MLCGLFREHEMYQPVFARRNEGPLAYIKLKLKIKMNLLSFERVNISVTLPKHLTMHHSAADLADQVGVANHQAPVGHRLHAHE